MKNTLLIINVEQNIKEARKKIKSFSNLELLYLNDTIVDDSRKYILFDDLIKPRTPYKIDKETKRFAENWYKTIEKDMEYFGISLGKLMERDFTKIWPVFLRIDILNDFIAPERISKIHLITEYDEDIKILKGISKLKKIIFSYEKLIQNNNLSFKELVKNKIEKSKSSLIKKTINLLSNLQNLDFKLFRIDKSKKNKILVIGNFRQIKPLLKELRKDKNNLIIRSGENVGKAFFNKYCDYYLTFSNFSNDKIDRIVKDFKSKL